MYEETTEAVVKRRKFKLKMGIRGLRPLKDDEKIDLVRCATKFGSLRKGKGFEEWKVA